MIKKGETLPCELREHMRGGDGTVKITNAATKDELLGKARLFGTITLEPGCGIGVHVHEGESELFLIQSGRAVYHDNGVDREVSAGDVTICEDGQCHGIRNPYDETATLTALIVLK